MKILILSGADVRRLLPMEACIDVMQRALADLARGGFHQPLRRIVAPPGAKGLLGLMPAYRPDTGEGSAFGLKAVGVFPGNPELGIDSHQGAVLLFSGETGELLALMDGSAITEIRTAAVSAVATRLLALDGAGDLAIIGSGIQARAHLESMACVRTIRRARVASRRNEHAQELVRRAGPHLAFPIEAVESVEAAVAGADLIVTATSAVEPILEGRWLSSGAHLNVVGSSSPRAREIDAATLVRGTLFVDRRESALNEAGDYLLAVGEGAIQSEAIRAEIGEVLVGASPGRTSAGEITVFKSLGLATEDLAAAESLYARAQSQGGGTWADL